jgi:menaquinone-dependent protoporphyrinogen oxidase
VQDVEMYDAVVLGIAVYGGRWLTPARQLVESNAGILAKRLVWLFSSGPVGDPSRKLVQDLGEDPVDLPALREATRARDHRTFAGKLGKRNLRGLQRAALTVFHGFGGDFRDWSEIEEWPSAIADGLQVRT